MIDYGVILLIIEALAFGAFGRLMSWFDIAKALFYIAIAAFVLIALTALAGSWQWGLVVAFVTNLVFIPLARWAGKGPQPSEESHRIKREIYGPRA